tara:strand:+ start:316 stop:750 length:435 start_codon:yes stop_codon:yes gene_type:complete
MRWISYILIFLMSACTSSVQPIDNGNTELIVTYEGKEVHRSGSRYSSMDDLSNSINYSPSETYIIFGAKWCKNCDHLYKALDQSGHTGKVLILNVDEPWVAKLAIAAGLKSVPTMIVVGKSGQPIAVKQGASQIVLYLVINVDV